MPTLTQSLPHQLLRILADGMFHSGEQLGRALNISRTAIWKQLHNLQLHYNLQLNAVKGKGYQLARPIEFINPTQVTQSLHKTGRLSHCHVYSFMELESTNQWLLQQHRTIDIHGMVCHAEFQSSGRGRRQRAWHSPLGCNLYFSLGWRFDMQISALAGLSLTVGVAVADTLKSFGLLTTGLKWPNDIYAANKKLAGILIELRGESTGPATAVIGIGINVNMPDNAANKIDQAWTDLNQQGLHNLSRNTLLTACITNLYKRLDVFPQTTPEVLRQSWQEYDILYNKPVSIEDGASRYHGIAKGIHTDGSLTVEVGGKLRQLHAGDVSLKLE